jgi:hypothetical protein
MYDMVDGHKGSLNTPTDNRVGFERIAIPLNIGWQQVLLSLSFLKLAPVP